jgi:hypothetical protein
MKLITLHCLYAEEMRTIILEYFLKGLAPSGSVLTLMGHSLPHSGDPQDRAEARVNCNHVSEFGCAETT